MDTGTVLTAIEIATEIFNKFDSDGDGQVIPQEAVDVLESFGNSEAGDNDIEILLNDIKTSLMYDENNTAFYEISSRLEVIDTRLDKGFEMISGAFSIVSTALVTLLCWKFFGWIMRLVSV